MMTTEEASAYIGVAKSTLDTWRSAGNRYHIPFTRVGRAVRYRRSALDKWIAQRTTDGRTN